MMTKNEERLIEAIESKDLKEVRVSLSAGSLANPKRSLLGSLFGRGQVMPLVKAAEVGSIKILKLLMEHGADVDQADCHGVTALAAAAQNGYSRIVEYLVDNGANVNHIIWQDITPICLAAFCGNSDVVELLLQRGANPEDVLKREISSLIRIRGGILRQLVAAGGAAPKEIDQLLRDKAALGD